MSSDRHEISNPLCGDVWKLSDGRHVLVDYKDGLRTGVMFSDGSAKGFNYTAGLQRWLEQQRAELVLRSEDSGFQWCNQQGWSRKDEMPTLEESLAFLRRVVARNGAGDDAPCARNNYNLWL